MAKVGRLNFFNYRFASGGVESQGGGDVVEDEGGRT